MRAPARVEPDLPPAPAEEYRYRGVLALDPAARADRAALLAALSDPSWRVRAAAEALAGLGAAAVEPLLEASDDPPVRTAAAEALGPPSTRTRGRG